MGGRSIWARFISYWRPRHDVRGPDHGSNRGASGRPAGASADRRSNNGDGRRHGRPDPGERIVSGSGPVGPDEIVFLGQSGRPRRLDSSLRDQLELGYLSGLQDQRAVLERVRRQTDSGMETIASNKRPMPATATTPGVSASTSTAREDDLGIANRCVTNNYNYEVPREPQEYRGNGLPAWALVLLLAGVLGLAGAWWLYTHWPQPVPSQPNTPIVTPVTPVAPVVPGGSQEYLDLR